MPPQPKNPGYANASDIYCVLDIILCNATFKLLKKLNVLYWYSLQYFFLAVRGHLH